MELQFYNQTERADDTYRMPKIDMWLGVEFVEVISEISYPLKGGSNCLGVIAIDQYYQEE